MTEEVKRSYLEITSLKDLQESEQPSEDYTVDLIEPTDFQLNKFFYKNIGKNHRWTDRLTWSEKQWIDYSTCKNVKTYVLKKNNDLIGYFELNIHQNETEIAYLGLLEEYQNKKLGSFLLSSAIKNSFFNNTKRVWVHTCSLDHKNALTNYIARGMKIFKTETIKI